MNPVAIEIENLGVLRDVTLDPLPEGLVGILGQVEGAAGGVDSNGAGKTTLVNAIVLALFGPDSGGPGRPTFAQDITRGEDHMRIQLSFEHAGSVYRVRREYTARSRSAAFDLERRVVYTADEGTSSYDWEPLTRSSVAETQQLLDDILGFSRETFLASVFLGQEDGCFADDTAREAKQLLTEAAFGRDPSWPRHAAVANEQRRRVETDIERLDGRVEAARDLAATKPNVLADHADAVAAELEHADTVADREREHQLLGQRWQQAREQDAARRAAQAKLDAARAGLAQLQRHDAAADEAALATTATSEELATLATPAQLAALETELAAGEAQRAAYRDRQTAIAEAQRMRDECSGRRDLALDNVRRANERALALRQQAAETEAAELATCQTCGQEIADEAKLRAVAELVRQAVELEHAAAENQAAADRQADLVADGDAVLAAAAAAPVDPPDEAAHAALVGRIRHARDDQQQRARLEERLVALKQAVDGRPSQPELADALRVCDEKLHALDQLEAVDVAAIEQEGAVAKRALDAAKVAFDTARTTRARLEERLAQITTAEEQIAAAAAERASLARQATIHQLIETGCGVNGVPTLILETAVIPFVETETARVLGELGVPFRVELRTQREKRNGGLAETLDVVIVTGSGDEAPYRKLSGGEKMRVSVALRAAVGRLGGVRSGLLVIDEPRWLDQSGVEALLASLDGLRGEFPRIYVVTQSGTTLRDSFDEVLTVAKDADGRSTVAEQGVFEPVPA